MTSYTAFSRTAPGPMLNTLWEGSWWTSLRQYTCCFEQIMNIVQYQILLSYEHAKFENIQTSYCIHYLVILYGVTMSIIVTKNEWESKLYQLFLCSLFVHAHTLYMKSYCAIVSNLLIKIFTWFWIFISRHQSSSLKNSSAISSTILTIFVLHIRKQRKAIYIL